MDAQKTSYYGRVERIMKTMGFKELAKFASLKTDEERFKHLYQNREVHKEISAYVEDPNEVDDVRKSDRRAREHRERGNRKYKAGDVDGALRCYNLAVLEAVVGEEYGGFCDGVEEGGVDGWCEGGEEGCGERDLVHRQTIPSSSHEMSYCLANRSACLILLQQNLQKQQQPHEFQQQQQQQWQQQQKQQQQQQQQQYKYVKGAIKDIRDSVLHGYPDSQKYKLMERKLKCLKMMEEEGKSMLPKTLNEYLESLKVAEMESSKRDELIKKIKSDPDFNPKQTKPTTIASETSTTTTTSKASALTPQTTPTTTLPDLTEIIFTPEKGNHVILKGITQPSTQPNTSPQTDQLQDASRENLKTGSVVMKDTTYFRVLDEEYFLKRCYSCYKSIELLEQVIIPCVSCNKVVFCSYKCRKFALETLNHSLECAVLPNLLASQTGCMARLALCVFASVGVGGWLKITGGDDGSCGDDGGATSNNNNVNNKNNNISNNLKHLNDVKSIIFKDATTVLSLLTHSEDKPAMALLQYCLLSVYLVLLLEKKTGVFGGGSCGSSGVVVDEAGKSVSGGERCQELSLRKSSESTTDDMKQFKVGGVVMKILEIISCNGLELTETIKTTPSDTLFSCQPNKTGLALFPKASFFNHSCFPDVEFIFDKDSVSVVTLKPVVPGAELCVDYGCLFHLTSREERKSQLKSQYFFDCKCQACIGNWPLKSALAIKEAEVDEDFEKAKNELKCNSKDNKNDDIDEQMENSVLEKVMRGAGGKNLMGELGDIIASKVGGRGKLPSDEKEFDELMKKALVDMSKLSNNSNNNARNNRIVSVEEAMEKATKMQITRGVIEALERYIDRNYSKHTSNQPSFNLIHAISTLKLCYRVVGV